MAKTNIAWLRNDLRIADNPALAAAARHGETVVAVYIHENTTGIRAPGAAARWWLHNSLQALGSDLAERGIALSVQSGDPAKVLSGIAKSAKAEAVYWNRRYAPGERQVDAEVAERLRVDGVATHAFAANLLVEPADILTGQGKPYSVFGPFWRNLRERSIERPLRRPDAVKPVPFKPIDEDYKAPKWSRKLARHWSIGEAAAARGLADFLDDQIMGYPHGRDLPGNNATSRLSPHLRFGEISPRQIWHAAQALGHAEHGKQDALNKFLSELAWREFNYHQLYHRDDITTVPMQPKYAAMPWRPATTGLEAWQRGQTGIPIVDAGMRELWETGFMQNRVRMLVASLLSKNMLIDWRLGEQWFWDCLVDGDVANNPANWQWVAGSGMDASPYFRIFNPVTQGERFDAAGDYVRRWVPELAALPDKYIHAPAEAPKDALRKAGVDIGTGYPKPVVDLKTSRERALLAFRTLPKAGEAARHEE